MPESRACSRCHESGLKWQTFGERSFLTDYHGQRHVCPPVTAATGVVRTKRGPDAAETDRVSPPDFTVQAQAAVLDATAQVMESFHRSIESARTTASDSFRRNSQSVIDSALDRATEEFRSLMPQQHEIVVRTPIGSTTSVGRTHFLLQRLVDWLNIGEHVMAVGPAGSGKSSAAAQAAKVLGLTTYPLSCGMSTNDWSLLGFINPSGDYVTGHMRAPYEHGGVFILDEIDNTMPSVLTTINGALDDTGSYQFPDALVQRHPDFIVVGCANTYGTGPDRVYAGRQQMDGAALDRFKKVSWGYDEEAEFDWAGRDQSQWIRYVQKVRACAAKLQMRVIVSPRASIGGAKGLRNGISWDVVSADCIFNAMSDDDRTRILDIVGAN